MKANCEKVSTGMLHALYVVTVLAIISLHVIGLSLTHEHRSIQGKQSCTV